MDMIPVPSESAAAPLITLFPLGDSNAISIPKSAHSLRGFRDWALSAEFPSRGQFTYLNGELIIEMSPEYFESHNAVKMEISAAIYGLVKHSNIGRFFGDRSLLSNEAANISTEPDAMFARNVTLQQGTCKLVDSPRPGVSQELVGTPDWVLEIVSNSSVRKDTKLLYDGYCVAGIGEFWLIDARREELDFQIFVRNDKSYESVKASNGWMHSPTFDRSFQLSREKDENGLWLYTLAIDQLK